MLVKKKSPVVQILLIVFMVVYLIVTLFPLYWMLVTSLKSNKTAYRTPPDFWPNPLTFENYGKLFSQDATILHFLWNSMVIGGGTVLLCLIIGTLAGYSLSRFKIPGKSSIMGFILVSQLFPLAVLLIPLYMRFTKFGWIDTYWSVILAHTAITLPYSIWLLKSFIDTIPKELEEAAGIDGCTRMGILTKIILPVITPGLVTAAVTSFLMSFREFLYALTLTSTEATRPISPGLQVYYMAVMSLRWADLMAAATFAIIPVIIIYIFLQKYVVRGLTGGAVKG